MTRSGFGEPLNRAPDLELRSGVGQRTVAAREQAQDTPQGSNTAHIAFELGYVFAAIAAGLIAFDKYFGLSTGWIRYIQTQEEHHRKMSYQEEFLALVKRHHIAYDERYLWE